MRQFILEEVKEALDTWRTTKKSKSQSIPDKIWKKIKTLKSNYTKRQIISTVNSHVNWTTNSHQKGTT